MYWYEKCIRTRTDILCPYWYLTPVYQLMRRTLSAFHLFFTGDPSNSKGWWGFISIDLFEMSPASLTMELHCLHTATSASVWLWSFAYIDWSVSTDLISLWYLGLGCIRFYMCSAMLMRRSSFPSGYLSTFRFVFQKYPGIPVYTVPPH